MCVCTHTQTQTHTHTHTHRHRAGPTQRGSLGVEEGVWAVTSGFTFLLKSLTWLLPGRPPWEWWPRSPLRALCTSRQTVKTMFVEFLVLACSSLFGVSEYLLSEQMIDSQKCRLIMTKFDSWPIAPLQGIQMVTSKVFKQPYFLQCFVDFSLI